jgi:hypothetical protein
MQGVCQSIVVALGLLIVGIVVPCVIADEHEGTTKNNQLVREPRAAPGTHAPSSLLAAVSNGDFQADDDDDEANEPVMVGGTYVKQRLVSDSRSIDAALSPVPTDLLDPAFTTFVDLRLLSQAWNTLDPALMTDMALQLAEGERVLMRPHKVFPADAILGIAVKMAIDKKDKITLDRLAKAVENRGNAALKSQVSAAQKLVGQSRAIDPAFMMPVDETTLEQFMAYQELLSDLRRARVLGDRETIEGLEEAIKAEIRLSEKQREYLRRIMSESRSAMPENCVADTTATALNKLSGTSRGNKSNRNEVRARIEGGGWNIVWGVTINEAEYAKFIAAIAESVASENPGPILHYFDVYLQRTIDKMEANAPGIARQALLNAIIKALKDRGRMFKLGRIGIKGGIVTYSRWYTQTVKVPDGTERYKIKGPFGTWTWGYRPKFKDVTKKVPLPNHHQPYIGFRLY